MYIYLATTHYPVCRLHCRLLQAYWLWRQPGTPPRTLSAAQFFDAVKNFDVESIERLTRAAADDDDTSEFDVNALYEFPFSREKMSALHYAAFMNETWVGISHTKRGLDCINACTRLTTAHVLRTCDVKSLKFQNQTCKD